MRERKPIDEALRRYLNEQSTAAGDRPAAPTNTERVDAARAVMQHALESRNAIRGLPNRVAIRETEITPGLSVRIYQPPGATPLPMLVYLHGGGWVAGSTATHDPFCRLLSEWAGVIIASVEFRRAPEHPYPEPLQDTLAAMQWAAQDGAVWGANTSKLALGGDSAGANLAAVAANGLCASSQPHGLRALLLLYPVTDHPSANHASYAENATGYGLEADSMRWFWNQYAAGVSPDDPQISPLRLKSVPALPPTLVATAEYDVLRDEGIAYAEKLRALGSEVTHLHAPDMHHNFPVTPATVARFPQCDRTLQQIADWLRETLAPDRR